jgi:hypothetical protein
LKIQGVNFRDGSEQFGRHEGIDGGQGSSTFATSPRLASLVVSEPQNPEGGVGLIKPHECHILRRHHTAFEEKREQMLHCHTDDRKCFAGETEGSMEHGCAKSVRKARIIKHRYSAGKMR